MDSIKPSEIVKDLIHMGAYKSRLHAKDILIRGFLSGSLLGFATVLAYTAATQTGLGIIGALVFPVGFAMIILLGLELVTGNFATVPMAVWGKETSSISLVHSWMWAFLGNLLGSLFFCAMFWTYITDFGQIAVMPDVAHKVIAVAEGKTLFYKELGLSGIGIAIVKAILCNWMVTMGVVMGVSSSSALGKIVALWLPIFTFFALGLEHSVVNMFVIPTAMMLGSDISLSDWWLWNQIPVTLGNVIGGALLTGFPLIYTFLPKNITGVYTPGK
ncbi:MAG: formate/nitrite transporter family protein [Chlorobi bacterium]|nr:MAG: formate/nitrite transporter family protein [Bacteroidota bacterium]KXK35280.1 MAG: putative formate transporter 1 [Chlorobi bacterium OLB6]MBE2264913.1 formate/nitrite transporter family protein [Flavobacteriales bacterium]MBL1160590.1 formate/nitrite transporter family protein [Chlorobiota bacterium]MBW7853162.1 formate/nitrite transporter family protein [Candidatus Kapabacteria bacterium]MCC6331349.1 formate/nitrite transporter family protein [Ignavibacteria bacterium]